MYKNIIAIYTLSLCVLFLACNPRIDAFYQYADIPNERWESSFTPSLDFYIQDTQCYYHLFVYIRHQNEYHFNNLWLQLRIQNETDTILEKKEFFLANKQKWLGQSITGNIIEHYIPITAIPTKLPYGKNSIQLEHLMREDPLEKILTVGIRLEKVGQ